MYLLVNGLYNSVKLFKMPVLLTTISQENILRMEIPQPMLSQRGHPLLVLNQQKFARQRVMSTGEMKWRCVVKSCNAFIKTASETNFTITGSRLEHKHDEVSDRVLQRQYLSGIAKSKAADSLNERPSKLIESILSNSPSCSLQAQDLSCIKRNLYNARRKTCPTSKTDLHAPIFYKECLVSCCRNNSSTHPSIEFFHLSESAYSYCKEVLHISESVDNKFCCEEHFDLRNDCINYNEHRKTRLALRDGALPRFNVASTVKFCLVPRCFSSKYCTPRKFFFQVPTDPQEEFFWLETIGDAKFDESSKYFCQDHFDLNRDIIDKDQRLCLKPDIIPHLRLNIKPKTFKKSILDPKNDHFEMEEFDDENGFDQFEKPITMDELKNQKVWVNDGSYRDENSTRAAFLLSLLPDLKEMSDVQIKEFKDGVSSIIKDILKQ